MGRAPALDYELIPLEDREAWSNALSGIPHAYQHAWEFASAMHLTTGYRTFLYGFGHGRARLVCPLVERPIGGGDRFDLATPSGLAGFVGPGCWEDLASSWRDFVRSRGYVSGYLGLHPLFEPPGFAELAVRHNSVYTIDLAGGPDALLRRVDRSRRRELRGWEARARDFVFDREAIADFLVANYEPFMRRAGARDPHLDAETLRFLCGADNCLAVAAASASELDAVYLFGITPHGGESLINVGTVSGRRRATDLLWWGVRELVARGVPILNLGGGAREDDQIARAKQRFRPDRLPLRAMRQVFDPLVYSELCRAAGVDPEVRSGYFPAYRTAAATRIEETA